MTGIEDQVGLSQKNKEFSNNFIEVLITPQYNRINFPQKIPDYRKRIDFLIKEPMERTKWPSQRRVSGAGIRRSNDLPI